MSRVAYSPLPLPSLRRTVQAFPTLVGTSPSADFSRPVRMDRSILSRDFATNNRKISRGKFDNFRCTTAEFACDALLGVNGRGVNFCLTQSIALPELHDGDFEHFALDIQGSSPK